MKVGEFSQKVGLPISTLHFYERKGLLHPIRNGAGHREYSESDLSWVLFINRLRDTGMPLKEIKKYSDLRSAGPTTMKERLKMLEEHREFVTDQIENWQTNLSHLDEKIEYYVASLEEHPDEKIRAENTLSPQEPPEMVEKRIEDRKALFARIKEDAKALPVDLPDVVEMCRESREELEARADAIFERLEGGYL